MKSQLIHIYVYLFILYMYICAAFQFSFRFMFQKWFSMITPLVMYACTLPNKQDNSNIKSHHRWIVRWFLTIFINVLVWLTKILYKVILHILANSWPWFPFAPCGKVKIWQCSYNRKHIHSRTRRTACWKIVLPCISGDKAEQIDDDWRQ